MNGAIGDILPLAIGVAISPIPIIAAILMLLSPRATSTSLGFLLGWTVGILVAVTIFTLLSGLLKTDSGDPSPVVGVIKIVLGIALLVLAVVQWRKRPKAGAAATVPAWMAAIDTMTAGKAAGLGFLLAAVNPKNLMMAIAAGVAIGAADISVGATVVVIAIFVILAITTVAIPVIGYLVAADRVRGTLERMRVWLSANNAIVMSVLLLTIGIVTIGKGIAAL
jgi:threonine/homoserine/homoserine lactone efflux protein